MEDNKTLKGSLGKRGQEKESPGRESPVKGCPGKEGAGKVESGKEESGKESLGNKFRLLHQILQIQDGRLSFWTGIAAEAFSQRESELYGEAEALLEHFGE